MIRKLIAFICCFAFAQILLAQSHILYLGAVAHLGNGLKIENSAISVKDDKFSLLKFISIFIGLVGAFFIIGFDTILNLSSGESKNLIPKISIIIAALGYVISSIIAYNIKKVCIAIIT